MTLEERVGRLEAQMADVLGETRTRKLTILDEAGRPRASLTTEGAECVLTMCDRNGTGRVTVTVGDGGTSLKFDDEKGAERVCLYQFEPSLAGLIMSDNEDAPRVDLRVTRETVSLGLLDEEGTERVKVMADQTEQQLALCNSDGGLGIGLKSAGEVGGLVVLGEDEIGDISLGLRDDCLGLVLRGAECQVCWPED